MKKKIELLCKLLPDYKQTLFKKKYQLHKQKNYKFRISKDGYLVYRRHYSPKTRYILTVFRNLVKVIIEYRDDTKKINEKLLKDLNFFENKKIYNLDASQKKEFMKKRYIQSFKGGVVKFLPEPRKRHKIFIPSTSEGKTNFSVVEFFKSFESKNTTS